MILYIRYIRILILMETCIDNVVLTYVSYGSMALTKQEVVRAIGMTFSETEVQGGCQGCRLGPVSGYSL